MLNIIFEERHVSETELSLGKCHGSSASFNESALPVVGS